MEKDSLIDDILKEKASSETLNLPGDLNLKIKQTISGLPDRKKQKSKFTKKAVTAAVITVVTVTALSAAFPSYARNVPVIRSVFDFLSENNIIDRDYIEYSSDLNLSKVSNDVTVTINSIVYDGITLDIAYTVENKEEMKIEPHIQNKEIEINGKKAGFGGGEQGKLIDKNTYVGAVFFDMDYEYLPKEMQTQFEGKSGKVPDNFIMNLDITELSNGIRGNWDFEFKVSKDKMKGKVKQIKTSIDLSEIRPGLKAMEVIFTPINTVLRTVENTGSMNGDSFIVLDDKGRGLEAKSTSGIASDEINQAYYQQTYRNIYEDTKSITFIPATYTKEFKEGKVNSEYEKKEVPLNINGTTILSQGKVGEYKITQIEFLEEKTLVHYECTNLLSTNFPYALSIIDSKGKKYLFRKDSVERDGNKFIAEIEPLSKNQQYKISAQDFEKVYDIREDLKFSIEVK